jgi:hypothetical protein|tara:strand:+ start:2392 stop:4365 length:1974 start_codon:yes stop_codon:yes gene_type:complete
MAKRKYTKRSEYWSKFDPKDHPSRPVGNEPAPELLGEPFYTSDASYGEVSKARRQSLTDQGFKGSRTNRAAYRNLKDRFSSIRVGMLPYEYASDGVTCRDAIELCQKAYANVAVFRNAIDIMAEFTNTDIYLEGGTKKSREFFYEWFKRINIINLKDQYFREYYRSGNIFLYRVDGKFKAEDYAKLMNQVGSINPSTNKIPLRYVLLNPYDIIATRATSFTNGGAYKKILSEYEIARLATPQTDEDFGIFEALEPEAQRAIRDGSYAKKGIELNLDPRKLSYSFYKKQDYEPFAVPFGFPVLEDINAKLELKKMDQSITRTVENVILLITMGADPEKGGVNPNNMAAMQNLFKNESVGRVLVSDYTTKAEFIIPELNLVLGPEKYQILNDDIKQGLQNIVVGEEKFNSTQVKAQIFIDRLQESRYGFLNEFLNREIKRIAKDLGFRSWPEARMKDIDMRDEVQLMRASTRLMELGIITPKQGMEMFHNGRFPEPDELEDAQKDFLEEREQGYYNPIVGGVPVIAPAGDKKTGPRKEAGRPEGTTDIPLANAKYSRANIQQTIYDVDGLIHEAKAQLSKKLKVNELTDDQQEMASNLCESIVCSQPKEYWGETLESCVKDFNEIENLETLKEVLDISVEHTLETYPSAILYHSHEIKP